MPMQVNPITGHEVNLLPMNTSNPSPSGWIRLLNGAHDAGYINLISPAEKVRDPALHSLPNTPPYIVIDMPVSDLPMLLDILRNEGKLQISYDDSGAPTFAMIGPVSPGANPVSSLKIVQELRRRLPRSA